jgi:hypothetical protein
MKQLSSKSAIAKIIIIIIIIIQLEDLESEEGRGELLKQIKSEMLTEDALTSIVNEYKRRNDALQPLVTCACCGVRKCGASFISGQQMDPASFDTLLGYTKLNLDDMQCLLYSPEDIEKLNGFKSHPGLSIPISETENQVIDVRRLLSFFEVNDSTVYYLHPEFVETIIEETWFVCQKKKSKPGVATRREVC